MRRLRGVHLFKEDHKDHSWNTIITAATLKARVLMKSMTNIEEEDIKKIDTRIKKAAQIIESNNEKCEQEIANIQKQFDAMVKILNESKEDQEELLRRDLREKNAEVNVVISNLEEKKNILKRVKQIKKNGSTMDDVILLKSHRELTKLRASSFRIFRIRPFTYTFSSGNISEEALKYMMGRTVSDTWSFLFRNKDKCI